MDAIRVKVIEELCPELDCREVEAVCDCLALLPEQAQKHLIENLFPLVTLRRVTPGLPTGCVGITTTVGHLRELIADCPDEMLVRGRCRVDGRRDSADGRL